MYCTRQRTPSHGKYRQRRGLIFLILNIRKGFEMESNNQSLSDLLIKSTIQCFLETSLCSLDDSVSDEFRKYSESNMFKNRFCFLK